jgi:hypothetical protein
MIKSGVFSARVTLTMWFFLSVGGEFAKDEEVVKHD